MAADRSDSRPFLICRCNGWCCALPVEHVVETMRPLPVAPVAGAPDFVLGVAVIRGALAPVVDLSRVLGAITEIELQRFITLRVGSRQVALALESVVGVVNLPAALIQDTPPLARTAAPGAVASITTQDGELLAVIEASRLLSDDAWAALDAADATQVSAA